MPSPRIALAAVALVVVACKQDHSALARRERPEPATGGAGGVPSAVAGGAAGAAGFGGGGASPVTVPPEPVGKNVLTLVHGVVDAAVLQFCLIRVREGRRRPAQAPPQPVGGLTFGESLSLVEVPGLDPASDDFVVVAIAASPGELEGLSCDMAMERGAQLRAAQPPLDPPRAPPLPDGGAGGEGGLGTWGTAGAVAIAGAGGRTGRGGWGGVGDFAGAAGWGGAGGSAGADGGGPEPIPPVAIRVHELLTVPAGSLDRGRSTLLVARGCFGGGTTLAAPNQEEICGTGYRPSRPTIAPVFAALSRIAEPDRVGIQVVHGASFNAEGDQITARLRSDDAQDWAIAEDVSPGAIAPPQPRLEPLARFGADPGSAVVEVLPGRSTLPSLSRPWRELAGPPRAGATYVAVVVGPGLRTDPGVGWWNPATISLFETTAQ